MKKNILLFYLLALTTISVPFARASDSATVVATVVLEHVSVSVSSGTVEYGILSLNSSTTTAVLDNTQTVKNEGNVDIDVFIRGKDSDDWELAESSDTDKYVHRFCNASVNNCIASLTHYAFLESDNYSTLSEVVAPGGMVDLDLHITTPTASASFDEQNVNVTIMAAAS